jgi:hypothetical protein
MDDQAQKRLMTVLSIVIGMILARPINNFIDEQIPERRGIGDDIKEAALQGLVRMAAIFVASVIVRRVASSRR